jgi:hypothetical protein
MKTISISLIALLLLALPCSVSADTLILRDGSQVSGTFAGATTKTISMKDSRGVIHRYSTSRIQSLEFTSYNQNTNGQNNNGQYNNGQNASGQTNNGGFGSRNNRTSSNNQPRETIPVGTQLVIRTNDVIDSKTASANQTFSAQFDQDVIGPSGRVVIPRGSDAKLIIRSVSGGSMTGGSDMVLDVQSISVNGRRYQISTADLNESSNTGIGKNKRTAEMIGGGAALGAIIGAVVGHGKGAAIGAAAGGAGGAGAQVLLKGKSVSVPAETILTFTLNQQVSI